MPRIKLTDEFGLDLDIEIRPESALARYFKNLTKLKFSELDFSQIRNLRLEDLPENLKKLGTSLSFEQPLEIGLDETEMIMGLESGIAVRIFAPEDQTLFEDGRYGEPVKIKEGQHYLSIDLVADLSSDLSTPRKLGFGISAGSEVRLANYVLFTSGDTKFETALKTAFEGFSIPGDIGDLEAMPRESIATVDGKGSLTLSGKANLLSAVNPLASVSLPGPVGELSASSGVSIGIGASFSLLGEYQIRIHKLTEDRIRLGFYRKNGSQVGFSASASVGLSAQLGKFELTEMLLKGISADPKADTDELKSAGLSQAQVESIEGAIKAGIERSLELALRFEYGSIASGEAMFLFEIDLGVLDQAGRSAVQDVLGGDLSGLEGDEETLPSGISLVRSIFTSIRSGVHSFKINLLGIYNYVSVSKLILEGVVLYDAETGELTITDKATASRIKSSMITFGTDSEKLRQVLAEHFLITAIYRGSKIAMTPAELKSSHAYFELHARTNRQTLKDNLDVGQALGLLSADAKESRLAQISDFGRSVFLAETKYDDATARSLFLKEGKARSQAEFEHLGRQALGLLIQAGDPFEYRRLILQEDSWEKMKKTGQPGFKYLFPGLDSVQIGTLSGDYTLITWWAKTMREAGEALEEMDELFSSDSGPAPGSDEFESRREKLAKKLKSVAEKTKERFGEPWGLVTMDLASGQSAEAEIRVSSPIMALQAKRD